MRSTPMLGGYRILVVLLAGSVCLNSIMLLIFIMSDSRTKEMVAEPSLPKQFEQCKQEVVTETVYLPGSSSVLSPNRPGRRTHSVLNDVELDDLTYKVMEIDGKRMFVSVLHYEWITEEEAQVFEVTKRINCKDGGIVVDVGMNDGIYTVTTAARGCMVYAFEIQKGCIDVAKGSIYLNGLENNVQIFHNPVSEKVGFIALGHDNTTCSGGYGIGRNDRPEAEIGIPPTKKPFVSKTLDEEFGQFERIDWLKIDTEGHDPYVLRGGINLFKNKIVKVANIEMFHFLWRKLEDGQIYYKLFEYGYKAKCFKMYKTSKLPGRGQDEEIMGNHEWDKDNISGFETLTNGENFCMDVVWYLPEYSHMVEGII